MIITICKDVEPDSNSFDFCAEFCFFTGMSLKPPNIFRACLTKKNLLKTVSIVSIG